MKANVIKFYNTKVSVVECGLLYIFGGEIPLFCYKPPFAVGAYFVEILFSCQIPFKEIGYFGITL